VRKFVPLLPSFSGILLPRFQLDFNWCTCTMAAVKPATRAATATKRTASRALDLAGGTNNNNNGFRNVINSKYVKRRCQNGQQSQPQPSASSSQMSQLMDEVLESVATQGQNNDSEGVGAVADDDGDAGFSSSEIRHLRKCVAELQQKVDFLMSIIGIDKQTESTAINPSQTSNQKPSYAAVTKLNGPVRNAVLTAVYSDLHAKENMKRNVVIYGLKSDNDPDFGQTDVELVQQLCDDEFHAVPVIERVKRLGRVVENRNQPLLVVLREERDAQNLLSIAKRLRQSADEYTRYNVYISAHQTRAERQAAFEGRCRRRQRVADHLLNENETRTDETSEPQHHRSSRGMGAPTVIQDTNGRTSHAQQPLSQSSGGNSGLVDENENENETALKSKVTSAVLSVPVVAAEQANLAKPVITATSAANASDSNFRDDENINSVSLRPNASEFRPTMAAAPTAAAAADVAGSGSSDGGTY